MKKLTNIKLTIIVPAYNEELIIRDSIQKIIDFLKNKKYEWELIVVSDGSKDRTSEIVNEIGEKNKNLRLIDFKINQGKGAAIRAGILAAKSEYIIFSDADLSVPINFVDVFLLSLEKDAGVVIGSRRTENSNIIKHQKLIRELLGRVFTLLSKITTWTNISDFTCGFKGFTRESANAIFSRTFVNRWVYDTEILFLAKKFRFKIVEVPVDWVNRGDSRVRIIKVLFPSLFDLFRIRLYNVLGKYA